MFILRFLLSNIFRRKIQTTDLADGGTTKELFLRVYYNPATPRDYYFNVTFTPNTAPYFISSIGQQYVNCGSNITIQIPPAVDDEGNLFFISHQNIPSSASSFTNTRLNDNKTLEVSDIN